MRTRIGLLALAAMTSTSYGFDLRPSVNEQIQIGQDAAAQIRKEEKVLAYSDPRSVALRKYGNMLVAQIPADERKKKPFQYSFEVIDSKEVNAFALPGGPVFFYTGLLDKMTTTDQLVGVLGHELTHIRNQHWASTYADTLKRQLGISLLLNVLGANKELYTVAGIVDAGLFDLPYSRKHESEADKIGYDMVKKAGYNPQGMADMFRVFANGKRGSDFDTFTSTHPDPMKRADEIEKRIRQDGAKFPPQRPLPFRTKGPNG